MSFSGMLGTCWQVWKFMWSSFSWSSFSMAQQLGNDLPNKDYEGIEEPSLKLNFHRAFYSQANNEWAMTWTSWNNLGRSKEDNKNGSLSSKSFTQLYPNSEEVCLILGMPPTKDKAQRTFEIQSRKTKSILFQKMCIINSNHKKIYLKCMHPWGGRANAMIPLTKNEVSK